MKLFYNDIYRMSLKHLISISKLFEKSRFFIFLIFSSNFENFRKWKIEIHRAIGRQKPKGVHANSRIVCKEAMRISRWADVTSRFR